MYIQFAYDHQLVIVISTKLYFKTNAFKWSDRNRSAVL